MPGESVAPVFVAQDGDVMWLAEAILVRGGYLAARNRHTILAQNLFCLVLVNFHRCLLNFARAKSVAEQNEDPQCVTRTIVRLSQSFH